MKSTINLQTLGIDISESMFFCVPRICIVLTLEQHFMHHWAVSDRGACMRKLFLGACDKKEPQIEGADELEI